MCGTKESNVAVVENEGYDVNRVDQDFNEYSMDLVVGETIEFEYDGGSEQGNRTVTIAKFDEDHIEGFTKERGGEYRSYLRDKIHSNLYVLSGPAPAPAVNGETLNVDFVEAGEALLKSLTGEQLAELYLAHVAKLATEAKFDASTGKVVVTVPKPGPVWKNKDIGNADFSIQKGDKVFKVWIYKSFNEIGVKVNDDYENTRISPENFLAKLAEFLSE